MHFIIAVSAIAALGGLLFGFDTAVISGAIPYIRDTFELADYSLGWAVGSVLIGCAAGAVFAGRLADRFGRRCMLFVCAFLFAISGIGAGLANTLATFAAFRFIGGLGVGAAAMISPMYIAETAPAAWRGRLVSLYQLAIVLGILLAYFANYVFADFGVNNWRWMFASQALPSIIFGIALLFVPETPRWLIGKSRRQEAAAVLDRILDRDAAAAELLSIERSFALQTVAPAVEAFSKKYRPVLITGVLIAVFQQVTGINAILYYAPVILSKTGLSESSSLFQTLGIGAVNVLGTLLAIVWVDRLGRKRLLLAGSSLMGACLAVVALCFHFSYFDNYIVLIGMLLYVGAFAATLGAVTWVYLSEIFPNRIRAVAMSAATLALWLADFVVTYTFPVITERLSAAATLSCYLFFCVLAFLYVLRNVPETQGRRLEDIEALFAGRATV
jgi:SP family arabinose:H+ symporter-like MFS transporter